MAGFIFRLLYWAGRELEFGIRVGDARESFRNEEGTGELSRRPFVA